MKKKLIVFHPAIAPYRVDFFNSIDEIFDAKFYFEFDNALEQTFDQKRLQEYLSFIPKYLSPGFLGIKNLRFDVLSILWKNNADVVFISEYNLLGLLVCLFKILVNWRLKIVTVCDDNVKMAQNASWVRLPKQPQRLPLKKLRQLKALNNSCDAKIKKRTFFNALFFYAFSTSYRIFLMRIIDQPDAIA